MISRSSDFGGSPRTTHPGVRLALIVSAAVGVYACDAAAVTEPMGGTWGRVLPVVDVTPGVVTLCQVGIAAAYQVRVGVMGAARTAQPVTLGDGHCMTVAEINPASQDDVVVSIDEAAAGFYAVDHIVFEHGTEAPRMMRGVDGLSFEGAHGALVTFFNNAAVTVCGNGTTASFQYQVGLHTDFQVLSLAEGHCSRIATIRPTSADDMIVTVRHDPSSTRRLNRVRVSLGGLLEQLFTGTDGVSFEGLHGAVVNFDTERMQ